MATATGQVAVNFVGATDENPWVETGFSTLSGGSSRILSGVLRPNSPTPFIGYTGGTYDGTAIEVSAEVNAAPDFDEVYLGVLDENGDGIMLDVTSDQVIVLIFDNYVVVDSAGTAAVTFTADDLYTLSVTKGTPNTYSVTHNGSPVTLSQSSYSVTLSTLVAAWALQNDNVGASAIKSLAVVSGLSEETTAYTLAAAHGTYSLSGQAATIRTSGGLDAEAGSYTLLGSEALRDIEVDAAQGSYDLNGQDADVRSQLILNADSGSYSLIGQAAAIIYSQAASIGRPRNRRLLFGFGLHR